MTEPLLSERREWTGKWWLPETPDEKFSGVLSYNPDEGIVLRLIGGWEYMIKIPGENESYIISGEMQVWPVIHGIGEGKYVTLLDAGVKSAKSYSGSGMFDGPDKLDLRAHTALIGCHLEDGSAPEFVAGIATVENMTLWSGRSGITMHHQFGSSAYELSGEIQLSRLQPLTADLGTMKVKLHTLAWQPFAETTRSTSIARVREHASVEFTSEDPKPVDEWVNILSGMGDLMSLSTLSACAPITLRVYLPPTPELFPENHPQRNMRHEVEVYQRRVVTPKPDADGAGQRDFILTLDDLEFSDLMPKWMEVRDKFAAARGMILGLRYVTGGYLETQVVTAVAAAESMHRALDTEPPLTEDEFKGLRTLLMAAVPKERKSWLHERLARNDPTLNQRLLELVARPGEFMSMLVPNREIWAKKAGKARNTLAHIGSSDDHTVEQLRAVVDVTSAVVILNLLFELGVPEDRLKRAIEEHPALSRAAELAQEQLTEE